MATLSLTILSSKPTKAGKFPIFVRIAVKNDKEYIKTEYQLDDACQWYEGKVVARTDATMLDKRLLYETEEVQRSVSVHRELRLLFGQAT